MVLAILAELLTDENDTFHKELFRVTGGETTKAYAIFTDERGSG